MAPPGPFEQDPGEGEAERAEALGDEPEDAVDPPLPRVGDEGEAIGQLHGVIRRADEGAQAEGDDQQDRRGGDREEAEGQPEGPDEADDRPPEREAALDSYFDVDRAL